VRHAIDAIVHKGSEGSIATGSARDRDGARRQVRYGLYDNEQLETHL
jgi:hypothetical protein